MNAHFAKACTGDVNSMGCPDGVFEVNLRLIFEKYRRIIIIFKGYNRMTRIVRISRYYARMLSWAAFFSFGVFISVAPTLAANTSASGTTAAISATESKAASVTANKSVTSGKTKKSGKKKSEPIFATVNGNPIPVREYDSQLAALMRQRFYHGSIPEDQVEAVRKEITDGLIERELLIGEAKRRGIVPEPGKFEKVLDEYDARYGTDPNWLQERERFLPVLKGQVDRQSLVEQMEKALRDVPKPTPKEVRAFYEQKLELFTEPASPRLSIILLRVDPSSLQEVWSKAREEAKGIYDRIKRGADFAEEARLHSAHASAANGGDMGYLHAGMQSKELENELGKLKIGEVSEPIRELEGITLYRIEDLIPAKLQEFQAVENRARDLLERDRADKSRTNTIRRLRATAKIKIYSPSSPEVTGALPAKK